MKINYQALRKSLSYLGSHAGISEKDPLVEILIREEDIEKGKLGDCLTLTFSVNEPASSYDSIQTEKTKEYTLEVFADHENRIPRLICVEIRDLGFPTK